MRNLIWLTLAGAWGAWFFPYVFLAPHSQKRESITVSGPTYLGLFFEVSAIFLAFWLRYPTETTLDIGRIVASLVCALLASVLSWTSVRHLGKQFRLRAGLYADHQLVRTGPYAVVRHPIYASLLAILLSTLFLLTPWKWMPVSLALFVLGTEIRVRTEDNLLASRFGAEFRAYQRKVPAYIPYIR